MVNLDCKTCTNFSYSYKMSSVLNGKKLILLKMNKTYIKILVTSKRIENTNPKIGKNCKKLKFQSDYMIDTNLRVGSFATEFGPRTLIWLSTFLVAFGDRVLAGVLLPVRF